MATLATGTATTKQLNNLMRTSCSLQGVRSRPLPAAFGLGVATRRRHVAVRAQAHAGQQQEAVLSGVDELPDGSLVLHFVPEDSSDGDTPETEKRLVTFLTKPVEGQQKRKVPTEVLEDVLGRHYHGHGNPTYGLKAFVKGVLAPAQSQPAHKAVATQHVTVASVTLSPSQTARLEIEPLQPQAPATQAEKVVPKTETSPVQQVVAPQAQAAWSGAEQVQQKSAASKSKSSLSNPVSTPPQPVVSKGMGVDSVRIMAVAMTAAITSAIVRALAAMKVLPQSAPWSSLTSTAGSLIAFAICFLFFWVTGFARSSPEEATA